MSWLSAVQLGGFVFVAFASALGLLMSVALWPVEKLTSAWSPDARHRALLLCAVGPMLLALAVTVAAFAPSILAVGWPEHDHCAVHPGHGHLCFEHPPASLASPLARAAFALLCVLLLVRVGRFFQALLRAARWASRLLTRAASEPRLGARILPIAAPLCVAVGLLRPVVVLSRGLLGSVTSEELRAILAHERAHARRRDTLAGLGARICSSFMLPTRRARLLERLDLAAEQSADEIAASAIGDRLAMAAVILKIERLLQATGEGRGLAASFGGSGVAERVAALLEPPREGRRLYVAPVLLLGAVIALFFEHGSFHHSVETLLGLIKG